MNGDLLTTPIVKSQILRYLKLGYSVGKIARKLDDIHLIRVPRDILEAHIREAELLLQNEEKGSEKLK